jgi:hypothetical protein
MGELREVERMSIKIAEPMTYTWICSHGKTLGEPCRQCDIARAKDVINQWGDEVDRARRIVGSRHLYDELIEGIDALQGILRDRK